MNILPFEAAERAADTLRARIEAPRVAIVLGSGLGAFAEQLVDAEVISYSDIEGFPSVGVVGHAGQLVVGRIHQNGPRVAALSGRVHLYEGHDANVIVHPTRTLGRWGIHSIVYTNAAGAIDPDFAPGNLMLITDHLNLTGMSPLTGHNDPRLGTRFPDMSQAYDAEACACFREAAVHQKVDLKEGVYAGLKGPSYETPAEIRMLGIVGANAVGMSTVCEVIAARHMGVRVAGISCITNFAAGLSDATLDHSEVKETADQARGAFVSLLNDGLARLDSLSG